MRYLKNILLFLIGISLYSCVSQEPTAPVNLNTKPNSPTPADGSLNIDLNTTLGWQCKDAVSFEIYFDTKNPPLNIISKDTNSTSIMISGLAYSTIYYWKVVAKFSNGSSQTGDIWSFLTKSKNPTSPGYNLESYKIETQLPCFVNILFQVTDMSGRGVTNLTTSYFEVFEDYQPISPTEAAINIKKKESVPYILKTVLMLDNSSSVAANLTEIKAAAINLINNIVPQQQFAIYKFSESVDLIQDFTNNTTLLQNAINSINAINPTTNLYGAVITGVNRWEDLYSLDEVTQGALILLTDGSDTQGSNTLADALGARGNKRIYTVGLGNEIDPNSLQQIGNAGFIPVSNVSLLGQKFLDIQNEMNDFANSFYWLNYMSPKRGNFNHSLELKIKNNPNSGTYSVIAGNFNSNGFFSAITGVYVNVTNNFPYGVDTVYIKQGYTLKMTATTYRGITTPVYSWLSSNSNIVKVESLGYSANVNFKGIGVIGSTAEVTVTDTANGFAKTLKVIIIN
jgi:VWFA-related protein